MQDNWITVGGRYYIRLTQGKCVEVDFTDLGWLLEHRWYAKKNTSKGTQNGKYYAARGKRVNGQCVTVYMHRKITNCPADKEVDHKDDNSLNNKRNNLVVLTRKQHRNKAY